MRKTNAQFLKMIPLFMVILLDVMGVVLVLPVLTPLILQVTGGMLSPDTSLAWRDFLYGVTLAIYPLLMFFSTPILGDLSDKFGRKQILLICLAGSTLGYIVAAVGVIYHSLTTLLISRAIAGLGAGTQPIASAAIIDMSTTETKTRNLSWVVLTSSVGLIIGPLVGGLTTEKNLFTWFGFDTPFWIAAVLSLANALFLYGTYKDLTVSNQQQKLQITKGFRLFLSAFADAKFRLLSTLYFAFILSWCLYFQAIGWFFMEKYHYSAGMIGIFIGYIGAIFVIATSVLVPIALKITKSEMAIYLIAILIMGLACLGCTLTTSELSQWLWVILIATGNVICFTVAFSLFSNLAGTQAQGWIMGVTGAIGAITWTLGGVIAGPLGYLNIHLPIWTAGGLCFFSFALMLRYRARHPGRVD